MVNSGLITCFWVTSFSFNIFRGCVLLIRAGVGLPWGQSKSYYYLNLNPNHSTNPPKMRAHLSLDGQSVRTHHPHITLPEDPRRNEGQLGIFSLFKLVGWPASEWVSECDWWSEHSVHPCHVSGLLHWFRLSFLSSVHSHCQNAAADRLISLINNSPVAC